jgi:heme A synthase
MGREFFLFAISVLALGVSIAFTFVPLLPYSLRVVAGTIALLSLVFLVVLLYIKERNAQIESMFIETTSGIKD